MTERAVTIGKGTKVGKELLGFIEEIEGVKERKKQLSEAEKSIFQEAKAKGFDTKTIRRLIAMRAEDVSKRQEAEALLDTYMHAIGMGEEPPLFAAMGAIGVDLAAREEAVEFLKKIVPKSAELILKIGGTPIRIFRDMDGEAKAEEVVDDPEPSVAPAASRASRAADFSAVGPTKAGGETSRVKSAADLAWEQSEKKRRTESKEPESADADE
jgi:uncharacterized protein (UPF0335 family)